MAEPAVGIAGVASYLPEGWKSAAEIAAASGIPEDVLLSRFGLRGKHAAAPGEHVTDLARLSLVNFTQAATDSVKESGLSLRDVTFVCPIHVKRSMHSAMIDGLGLADSQAVYLEDTGHMSGVDNLVGLDRLARAGRLRDGDVVVLLAAGIGYTWAATTVRWGSAA